MKTKADPRMSDPMILLAHQWWRDKGSKVTFPAIVEINTRYGVKKLRDLVGTSQAHLALKDLQAAIEKAK